MYSLFNNSSIRLVKPIYTPVAGVAKAYEIWTFGSIIQITKPEDVELLEKKMKQAHRVAYLARVIPPYVSEDKAKEHYKEILTDLLMDEGW